MRTLLMDHLCEQGCAVFTISGIGYGHREREGVYSIIEKSVKDWAYTIYNWVRAVGSLHCR